MTNKKPLCFHVRTVQAPVQVSIDTGGGRGVFYTRQELICVDCGDTIAIPTPGLVVSECLALFADEGQNSSRAWMLERHLETVVGR